MDGLGKRSSRRLPKLLITGASGFVGTTAREYFKQAWDPSGQLYEVLGVDKVAPRETFPEVRDFNLDLLLHVDVVAMFSRIKPDYVIHLAAQARVEPSLEDPIGTYRTNVEATINVLDACEKAKVKRLIYASSEAIYGQADKYPTKESDHFRPISPYAASKIAGDVMVQQFKKIPTIVIRSGMGFGPRSPPEQVITKFMLRAMDGKDLKFPAGDVVHPTRDVNYIENWMDGIHRALEKENPSSVYNIGGGREYTLPEIAQEVIKVVGSGRIVKDPGFKYREGEEGMRTWLDSSKAGMELGYAPKVSLQTGLHRTYDWLKHNRDYWSESKGP